MPPPDRSRDEFALIGRFFQGLDAGSGVVVGNGDDAAVLGLGNGEELAVSVDAMVEGVHFPGGSEGRRVAYRAVAAAVSDLAAMGARPLAMTLAISIPDVDERWLTDLRVGLERAVRAFSLPLVGGDLTRGALSLAVQVMGALPAGKGLKRSGARPGDRLFVSGTLGDSAAGLAVESKQLASHGVAGEALLRRFWEPAPALALGQQLLGRASAAIDISDGLLADVGHLAEASGVSLHIDSSKVPLSEALLSTLDSRAALELALGGGEDYVLCFTLPPQEPLPSGVFEIGAVREGTGVDCDVAVDSVGFRHFS